VTVAHPFLFFILGLMAGSLFVMALVGLSSSLIGVR
jgi:hypothetical protein